MLFCQPHVNISMRYWSRDNTREWINQLQNRVEDIHYYLAETIKYCEKNAIFDNKDVLILSIMTCVWVVGMRNETISLSEMIEILNLDMPITDDKIFDMGRQMEGLDFEQMLAIVSKKGPYLGLD